MRSQLKIRLGWPMTRSARSDLRAAPRHDSQPVQQEMKHQLIARLLAAITIGALCQATAAAGTFRVACSYENDNLSKCASVVSDIVTDKFIAKFPSDRYSIFVHSDIHSYSNGGYVAYAVTGVVPTGSSQFPIRRFSATTLEREKRADRAKLGEVELENFRDAVKQLMDHCDLSPDCDIYIPSKRK
ncbi:MAG: hypothetical protein MZW92_57225 [Comamonadaceae bacterium]|nr:hypothetical protein [Comamonadaceae bacterium]